MADKTYDIPMRVSVLADAAEIIHGARQQEYGGPAESFGRIARMWTSYLGYEISAQDVAMMMILLKVSRAKNGIDHNHGVPQRDSLVDICGYAGCSDLMVGADAGG